MDDDADRLRSVTSSFNVSHYHVFWRQFPHSCRSSFLTPCTDGCEKSAKNREREPGFLHRIENRMSHTAFSLKRNFGLCSALSPTTSVSPFIFPTSMMTSPGADHSVNHAAARSVNEATFSPLAPLTTNDSQSPLPSSRPKDRVQAKPVPPPSSRSPSPLSHAGKDDANSGISTCGASSGQGSGPSLFV